MSAAPKQVREQAARIKEFYDTNPADKDEDVSGAGEPAAESDVEDEAVAKDPEEESNPGDRAPATSPKPEPDPEPEPKPEPWEHRYRTLKGMYDAEVPRLHAQVKEMKGEMDSMRELLASLQPSDGASSEAFVSEKDVEEYGEDFFEAVGRKAREIAAAETKALRKEIETLKNQLGGVNKQVQTSVQERMISTLAAQVPDWQAQNVDPGFLGWLDDVDPYSGQPRRMMLNSALENNDTARVVAFFKGYQNERTTVSPPAEEASAATPKRSPKVPLGSLASPGAGRVAEDTTGTRDGTKRTWTKAQIAQFYKDIQLGKYKGSENRQKERMRIERDIFAAGREGRVLDQ